jgi:hypothetical protein
MSAERYRGRVVNSNCRRAVEASASGSSGGLGATCMTMSLCGTTHISTSLVLSSCLQGLSHPEGLGGGGREKTK